MHSTFILIGQLHRSVALLVTTTSHVWRYLERAMTDDATAPHPDDIPELDAMMEGDANVLRELAHEIEMRRIELKRSALQYQLEAAE